MVEEERGDTRLLLAIDDGPVDGRRPAVLRQECRMHIEGAESRHSPHHLRQHSEGHHHLQVGLILAQLLQEFLVFHFRRLQHGQVVL